MSKMGVGVGEEFPVDDGDGARASARQGPEDADRAALEAWKRRRAEERRYHEEMRRQAEEWAARKRAFKEKIRAAAREFRDYSRSYDNRHSGHVYYTRARFWPWGAFGIGALLIVVLVPVLILAGLFSLVSAMLSAPLFLGVVAVIALGAIAAHYDRHRHYAYRSGGHYRHYSDDDIHTPPRSQPAKPPSGSGTVIDMPPPSQEP